MLKQIGVFELIQLVKGTIQENTELPCYEKMQNGVQLPYCYVELNEKVASNTETMWRDTFTVHIHIVCEENEAENLSVVEEAMCEGLLLPKPYKLLLETNTGVVTKQTNENSQNEIVTSYEYVICYGYKSKL